MIRVVEDGGYTFIVLRLWRRWAVFAVELWREAPQTYSRDLPRYGRDVPWRDVLTAWGWRRA